MHNIEDIREYCLSKRDSTESMPFGDDTLVFKVADKMFALVNLEGSLRINLKCKPEIAIELREEFIEIQPAFHMNKNHWNSIYVNTSLKPMFIKKLIDDSYNLVFEKLSVKKKNEIENK